MTDPKLAVVLEGGLVQTIVTDDESLIGMVIEVIDYDTEGADDDEITFVLQSDGSYADAIVNTITVKRATIGLSGSVKPGELSDENGPPKRPN